MKVAHLLRKYDPSEWGGTETALLGLCDGLRRLRVDSVIYGPRLLRTVWPDPLADIGCRIERYSACIPIAGISRQERWQRVAVAGNLMSFDLPWKLWREPDLSLIHAHTTGRIGSIGRVVARRRRLPFVVTLHGAVYNLPNALRQAYALAGKGWEWGSLFSVALRARSILSLADLVLVGNAADAALVRARHPGQTVMIHPHGIAIESYRRDHRALARASYPALCGRDLLVVVGRIDPAKNQSWLLERMPELTKKNPKLMLVLAGAATDRVYAEGIERRVDELGQRGNVLLAGGFPPEDPRLIGLMQEARAVVLPSLAETFGLVILEAWAAGTAIAATRTVGALSLIEDGKCGLLFDLEHPDEFCAGLNRLLSDPGAAARLIEGGRQRVGDFGRDALAARLHGIYGKLIKEKDRSPRRVFVAVNSQQP